MDGLGGIPNPSMKRGRSYGKGILKHSEAANGKGPPRTMSQGLGALRGVTALLLGKGEIPLSSPETAEVGGGPWSKAGDDQRTRGKRKKKRKRSPRSRRGKEKRQNNTPGRWGKEDMLPQRHRVGEKIGRSGMKICMGMCSKRGKKNLAAVDGSEE